ncbi:MAG: hypothetical protein RR614_07635, partial [Eubacterium sp.]
TPSRTVFYNDAAYTVEATPKDNTWQIVSYQIDEAAPVPVVAKGRSTTEGVTIPVPANGDGKIVASHNIKVNLEKKSGGDPVEAYPVNTRIVGGTGVITPGQSVEKGQGLNVSWTP